MADETDTTDTPNLMATTSHRALLGRMTPMERVAGRFMRAPDHGDDAGGGDGADGGDTGASGDDNSGGADDGAAGAKDGQADAGADKGDGKDGDDASLMGKAGEEEGKEPDPATLPPEKYELAAPEGFAIDEALQAAADPVFRELGLTNEQANKLMPLVPQFAEKIVAQQNDAFQAMKTDWAKQSKADKDLGGANWGETESLVAKALDSFGAAKGSDFRKLLDETGLGNHPEMIRMFRKIGAQIGEGGGLARGDTGPGAKVDRLSALYPDDVPKQEAN